MAPLHTSCQAWLCDGAPHRPDDSAYDDAQLLPLSCWQCGARGGQRPGRPYISCMLLFLLLACPPVKTDDTAVTPISCGTALCAATEVCVAESYSPTCESRSDTGASCPEGTTPTLCGGDGHPCCCGPTPAATYACQACGEAPSCECVVCPAEKACSASASVREYICEELAVP